jgi:hypothetical protein
MMAAIDRFYNMFPKADDETDDEFNRWKYAMEDMVQTLLAEGSLNSIYRMSLPFRVDPTVRHVRILGTTDGCRFAHVDLAEKKKIEVEQVIMMDKRKLADNNNSSNKRASYSNL